MALSGFIGLFRVPPQEAGGRMALADHFRELRARLLRVLVVVGAAFVVALVYYQRLFDLILSPYNDARTLLKHSVTTEPVITGIGGPFMLELKMCAIAALIVTSPFWLYQVWAFVLPGLHPHERRWTRLFTAIGGPLFFLGVGIGYWVLPKAIEMLLHFTPGSVQSLVDFNDYFTFVVRMMLVFGIAFEIPLFIVLLNLAGVVSGAALAHFRPWIVVGAFVFAAIATPSPDPFSMLMLAVPLTALFMLSEVIAKMVDKRRARAAAQWSDDEVSPI